MGLLFNEYDGNELLLKNKKYALGLDLSTVSTGMALYNIEEDKVLELYAVRYNKDNKIFIQADMIIEKITEWVEKYSLSINNTIFAKEKQPIQYGRTTTISTIVSIAKIHGLVEEYFFNSHIPLLDLAVPTIRKYVLGDYKADKEETYKYITQKFNHKDLVGPGSYDMVDALAVCIASKQGLTQEYQEQIKELKKEKKSYKLLSKQQEIENKIQIIKDKIDV